MSPPCRRSPRAWSGAVVRALALLVASAGAVQAAPGIVSPADGDTLDGSTVTFTWSADDRDVVAWFLNVGTAPGARDIASSGKIRKRTAFAVSGLPQDGSTVHARLFARTGGRWLVFDTRYATRMPGDDGGTGGEQPGTDVPLVLGRDATPPSGAWTRPRLGETYPDPVHGTPIRRVTDAGGTRFDRNTYSRRRAENADGSRFLSYHGTSRYRVHDRRSLELVRQLDIHPDAEPQWHPTDPDLVRHIAGPDASSGDLTLLETRASTGRTTVIADLTDRLRGVFPTATHMKDKAEGSPSADGSRHAWIVQDAGGRDLGIVSYDLATDRILGTRPVRRDAGRLDWVSVSPTGRHVVAGYVDATLVHPADLANERRINDKADHSDIALDASGRDAYVYIDFSTGPDAGWLVSVDLATLGRTRLIDLYERANTSLHVSGKGYDKPGWVVVSTYDCKVDGAWTCDKVLAVEMKSDPTIVNLAHTYNCGESYWTETHAVVNRAFTRIHFNSDAGRCTTEAEVYELAVPTLP